MRCGFQIRLADFGINQSGRAIGGWRHRLSLTESAVKGTKRPKARIQRNGEDRHLALVGVGQRLAHFGKAITIEEGCEIPEAQFPIDQAAQAIFLLPPLRVERGNGQTLCPLRPLRQHVRLQSRSQTRGLG